MDRRMDGGADDTNMKAEFGKDRAANDRKEITCPVLSEFRLHIFDWKGPGYLGGVHECTTPLNTKTHQMYPIAMLYTLNKKNRWTA